MTDDQREQLNRFLAERVMGCGPMKYITDECCDTNRPIFGWNACPVHGAACSWEECTSGYRYKCGPYEFWAHPSYSTSWPDCEPLLDKIERDGWKWDWDNFDDRYTFEVMKDCDNGPNENSLVFHVSSKTRTEALCLAVGRAYGWKVEG